MPTITEKLADLITAYFAEEGREALFLVEIENKGENKVQVFIDSDEGINFGNCARLSRHLEAQIEENGWLGEKYTLDVSSPGLDRPLKLHRQYVKNIGRELSVEIEGEHKHAKGKLEEVTEEHIVLTYSEKVKLEGRKKKELVELRQEIPFERIKKALVKITF